MTARARAELEQALSEARGLVSQREKEVGRLQKKSADAGAARDALGPCSTRAHVTTANARWARAAEARERATRAWDQARTDESRLRRALARLDAGAPAEQLPVRLELEDVGEVQVDLLLETVSPLSREAQAALGYWEYAGRTMAERLVQAARRRAVIMAAMAHPSASGAYPGAVTDWVWLDMRGRRAPAEVEG